MSETIKLTGSAREGTLGHVRTQGSVPGILYGHGIKNQQIQVDAKQFAKTFRSSGYTTLINLVIGETAHNVIVREVQFHPIKDHVTHVDFYQVRMDEKIRAQVPLNFVGESTAIKDGGGVLVRSIDTLDLEALPQDLPHDIKVDISVLGDFEAIIHVSDLQIPAGITLFNEPTEVVAVVQAPRTEQELESLSEEATEDVSAVETIKKEKAEDEPAEGEETAPAEPAKE